MKIAQINSQSLASTRWIQQLDYLYIMAESQKKVSQSTELICREKISDENHLPKIHKRTISESAADKRRLHKQNQKQNLYRQISWNDCNNRNRVIFAEGWKNLTDEERAKLEIDIFKPLDFYEILFNRIKSNNTGKVITSLNELDFM